MLCQTVECLKIKDFPISQPAKEAEEEEEEEINVWKVFNKLE